MAPLNVKVSNAAAVASSAKPARSISCDDAIQTLRHDRQMKRALLGIPFPVVFFCIFATMLSRHIPTSELYEQAYSVSSVLDSSGTDAVTAATTMKLENVQTISDVFDWLTDTFVPSVFVTEDYNGNLLTSDKWGRIASFNKVLGAVLFQTTRAAIHKCQAAQFLVDLYPNCYDAANTDTKTKLISFDKNGTEAASVISELKAQGDWLDFSTQQLLITVVAYNGEVQGYTVTKLQLDFHQGGYIEVSAETTPTISDPYKHTIHVVLDVLVGVCLVIALVDPLARFLRALRSRHTWRQIDVVGVVGSLAPSAFALLFYAIWFSMVQLMYDNEFRDNLARLVVSGNAFDPDSKERDGLLAVTSSLEAVARMTTALRLAATGAVFALGVDVLMQFRFHPRLNILTRTLANALHQFAGFFIVFVVVFLTFAVSGTVLFGDRVDAFSTLPHTMESCVNMLFGNFDYSTVRNLQAPVGMLYYWAYMVVVCLVLLNMMLAIVLDSYAEMSQEAALSRYNVSLRRTVDHVVYDRQLYAARIRRAHKFRSVAYSDSGGDYKRLDVVFQGRVIPDVLEAALVANKPQLAAAGASAWLTETMLAELFPETKLTAEETRETMTFLLEGCLAENADHGDGREAATAKDVEGIKRGIQNASTDEQQKSSASSSERAELMSVRMRMEVLELKLDCLLSQSSSTSPISAHEQ